MFLALLRAYARERQLYCYIIRRYHIFISQFLTLYLFQMFYSFVTASYDKFTNNLPKQKNVNENELNRPDVQFVNRMLGNKNLCIVNGHSSQLTQNQILMILIHISFFLLPVPLQLLFSHFLIVP